MNLYDFFESDIIPMPIANDPNKDYAIFGDGKPVVKFQDKREALATFNELSKKFPEVKFEIRPLTKLNEAGVAQTTARALAQELYADIKDLIAIRQAGSPTGAGNPHNAESLSNNIRELYHELEMLGYEFDAASPGYIRPLTVDVDTTPQARLREMRCVECGGAAFSNLVLSEKQDACYYKVKSRYKVWPSAYASGALVQCRKKGAANWGNKSKNESVAEGYYMGGLLPGKYYLHSIYMDSKIFTDPQSGKPMAFDSLDDAENFRSNMSGREYDEYQVSVFNGRQLQSVAEEIKGLNEFAPGSPGGDGAGEDPYGRPEPKHYARSIDYFGRFEADHFDREDFDKATGVFRGYWQDDDGGFTQIGYFKFDNPARTGSDDPGMGWYYEPMDESLNEFTSKDNNDGQDEEDDAMEAQFTVIIAGKPQTGTVRVFPGTTTDVEYYLNGKVYIKNNMQNVDDYDDFIENAAGYIQEIIQLKGDGHHFVEQGLAENSEHDIIAFEIDSENAYNRVMQKFGNQIGWDGETMLINGRFWPAVQELAYEAGGEATEVGNEQGIAEEQLDEKCWDTHRRAGMKKKGDRMVPNCVPKEGVTEGLQEEDPLELSSDYALYIADAGRKMMTQLTNLSKKIQTDSTAAQNAKRWMLGDYLLQHYKIDDLSAINQVFEEYGVGGLYDNNLYELLANWSSQGAEYVNTWKQYSGDVIKNSTRKPGAQSVHEQGVAEGYPKHQDLSGISTDKLKAYLDKQSKQQVSGEGNQVKRVRAELQRREQGVAEGSEQQYLWHGSRQKIPMLEPRQSVDTGGAAGSNQNAIYATSDPKVAIAMGLTTPGSDTGMFPNDPQMVLFSGKVRKGENVYLHKVPMNGPDGKPQFVQGGNSREFHSVPGVKGIKPTEIKAVPVDKYLNLIRQATPQDLELRKKYMKQGVAEGSEDLELYGLRIGDTVKATIGLKRVQGDIIDIFPETQQVELLLRGANAGRTVTVDVQDTEKM